MKQQTLAQGSFELYRKPTKREKFLNDMEQVIPWQALHDLLVPYYPKAGNGRPPVGLMKMLRLHFLQHWYNLSDPGLEEALYESESMRCFAGIDLGCEPVPDETTILRFRRMLEEHDLGRRLFAEVGRILQERGIKVSGGTIVDATIIAAPSSTKNADKKRDPEMRSTKKGNQWHFGMKLHIGVDSKTGTDPQCGGQFGQRARQRSPARSVAWERNACVWRQRVPGSGTNDTQEGAARKGLHTSACLPQPAIDRE